MGACAVEYLMMQLGLSGIRDAPTLMRLNKKKDVPPPLSGIGYEIHDLLVKYISFPILRTISTFCTDKCQLRVSSI